MTLLRDEGLTAEELAVWRMMQRAQVRITRHLEAELLVAHDLPLASYEVLVQLAEAPERRLRMNDLAGRVLLSRSGLTRLIDRLQRDGLVSREACADDARGLFAVLTDAGAERLAEATPTYLRGVRTQFLDLLGAEEITRVRAMVAKLDLSGSP
ncbi:MarR family winged helix-turn-helix transcriptional regulator [Nonomuraea angiospora]|uniref:DNA-binding MarR family transcriptional regulator n=1 Tax=Nonomuraea angiospora TaxID=46172 RepID=A0ABR9M5H2_9ACTN|nr:MarR family transcriptional regulator [Nonomuraea angiospora]MBE1587546.1 DNA-binding MarR family transcriptional regulator [Nonomuraea angiospora]MDX3101212.1 MarR family transcriptional regulator [Nonomuraea angiospora]